MSDKKYSNTIRGDIRIYNRVLSQEEIDDIKENPYALYEPISSPRYWPIRPFWKRLLYRIRRLFK